MTKKEFNLKKEIDEIINQIDSLKDKIKFYEEQNEEDGYDALENCIVNLDEFQEIHKRDAEYQRIKKVLKE